MHKINKQKEVTWLQRGEGGREGPGEEVCPPDTAFLFGVTTRLTRNGESAQSFLDGAGDGAGEQMEHEPGGGLDER